MFTVMKKILSYITLKRVIIVTSILVGLVILWAYSERITNSEEKITYDKAITALEGDMYEVAYDRFVSLNYRESETYAKYTKAFILMEDGKYREAIQIFEELDGFRNSSLMKEYCKLYSNHELYLNSDSSTYRRQVYSHRINIDEMEFPEGKKRVRNINSKIISTYDSKVNEEKLAEYRDIVPYAGMSKSYISMTAAGPYTREEKYRNFIYYYWDLGEYTVMRVRVADEVGTSHYGSVTDVKQYYREIAWKGPGKYLPVSVNMSNYDYGSLLMPRFGPYCDKPITEIDIHNYLLNKKKGHSSISYDYEDDDYGDYGYYDDFEDFYNDHYDDFDSYREAEDYFDTYY